MVTRKFYILILPVILLFIHACNSGDNDPPGSGSISHAQQLKNLIAKYPDSLLLTVKLIEYYSGRGNYDSAINVTVKAIQKDSANVEL